MGNNDIDRAFAQVKILSQKKGYLSFDELEKGIEELSLNEVDWLTNSLIMQGVTKDVQFVILSTATKVLIGNSVNGNIIWVDSKGDIP